MSPGPRARTRSARMSASWPAPWAGASPTWRVDWRTTHERYHARADPAGLPHRPDRMDAAAVAATALARLAVSRAGAVALAAARLHRAAVAAAPVRHPRCAPCPAVGRHPQPVLFLPRGGRGVELARRTGVGADRDRAGGGPDRRTGRGRQTAASRTARVTAEAASRTSAPSRCTTRTTDSRTSTKPMRRYNARAPSLLRITCRN